SHHLPAASRAKESCVSISPCWTGGGTNRALTTSRSGAIGSVPRWERPHPLARTKNTWIGSPPSDPPLRIAQSTALRIVGRESTAKPRPQSFALRNPVSLPPDNSHRLLTVLSLSASLFT